MRILTFTLFLLISSGLSAQEEISNLLQSHHDVMSQVDFTVLKEVGCFDIEKYEHSNLTHTESQHIAIDFTDDYYTSVLETKTVDAGELSNSTLVYTYGKALNYGNENISDSTILYSWNDTTMAYDLKILVIKNTLSGTDLLLSENYVDYGLIFGDASSGLLLGSYDKYYYDNNKLKAKAEYILDGNSGLIERADSIVYAYNTGGDLLEGVSYETDGSATYPIAKDVFSYNIDGQRILKQHFEFESAWEILERDTFQYDAAGRKNFTLRQQTFDNGESWKLVTKDSLYYTDEFNFGTPSRAAYLQFSNEEWKYYYLNIFTSCFTSAVTDPKQLEFKARFSDNGILVDLSSEMKAQKWDVQLTGISGRTIFSARHVDLAEPLLVPSLSSSVYFLTLKNSNSLGTVKLYK